ncbi:MAG: hypothetical protein CMB97_01870 [Flavobacteriaceae bacterium]|nr:hypothetical protein [Flavobacteriaceae bacterium]
MHVLSTKHNLKFATPELNQKHSNTHSSKHLIAVSRKIDLPVSSALFPSVTPDGKSVFRLRRPDRVSTLDPITAQENTARLARATFYSDLSKAVIHKTVSSIKASSLEVSKNRFQSFPEHHTKAIGIQREPNISSPTLLPGQGKSAASSTGEVNLLLILVGVFTAILVIAAVAKGVVLLKRKLANARLSPAPALYLSEYRVKSDILSASSC